jgi:hypothetical protein
MIMQIRANPGGKIGSCGCGRSPTGDCIGWHGLTEEAYEHAKRMWINEQFHNDAEAEESEGGTND